MFVLFWIPFAMVILNTVMKVQNFVIFWKFCAFLTCRLHSPAAWKALKTNKRFLYCFNMLAGYNFETFKTLSKYSNSSKLINANTVFGITIRNAFRVQTCLVLVKYFVKLKCENVRILRKQELRLCTIVLYSMRDIRRR